jgi:hypothetical protein
MLPAPSADSADDVPYAEEIYGEEAAQAPPPRRSVLGLLMVFALCLGMLGVAALLAVLMVMQRQAESRGELGPLSLERYTGGASASRKPGSPTAVPWHDAKAGPLTLGSAKIEVTRAEYGEVRGKDGAGNVIISDEPYLSILVQIENRQRSPINYRSWYGNEFKSRHGPVRAWLVDQDQREYKWTIFNDVKRVRWHTPVAVIDGGKSIEDVLVFTLPQNREPAAIKFLRLELPGEAVGQTGKVYRFEIPRQMIEGL